MNIQSLGAVVQNAMREAFKDLWKRSTKPLAFGWYAVV